MKKVLSLAELAVLTNSELIGNAEYLIHNVADLESATSFDASFLANPKYEKAMHASKAGVVFISSPIESASERNFLISEDPSRAFQIAVEAFYEDDVHIFSGFTGIHSTAVIHETARLGKNITIGPHAVIDQEAVIGDNSVISASCYIGFRTIIGQNTFLHPHVTIRERCQIGNRVIIQPGAVIGSCGFGYTMNQKGQHIKLNQVGIVVVCDDVEIGANTTIDRSRFKATYIGQGSKIDNLVQIGHGVEVGTHNIIVAQTGIAGSTKTGTYVVIGGHAAIAGHLTIANQAMVAARSGVTKSLKNSGKYGGMPAVPLQEHNRNQVFLKNIGMYIKQQKHLAERLNILEKNSINNKIF